MAEKKAKNWKAFQEAHVEENGEEIELDPEKKVEETEETSALEYPDYESLEEKLTLAEQTAHENWEKCVRAQAELENVRQRAGRDVENAVRYGNERLIKDFLQVADSLGQAVVLAEEAKDKAMTEGLSLTLKLLLDVFQKHHVVQLNPEGEPFNPEEHEAMMMQASDTAPPNTVLSVFQKGYTLNGRVIRPARVIVSKAN